MILFYALYQMKEGKRREDFFRELQEADILALTRKEEGNLFYDFAYSAEHQQQVNLVEAWSSDEDLMAHKETVQFFALQDIKAKYMESMQLKRFEVKE